MRIWLLKTGEQIPDDPGNPRILRTGVLCEHLLERGHDVTWWNATLNHQRKIQRATETVERRIAERYRIILLAGRLYESNVSITRILSHLENAREFSRRAAIEPRPDVILCSYPTIELAAAATRYALKHNIPIAVDFRDMWPDIMEHQLPMPVRLLASPAIAQWRRMLRYIVRNATSIVGITEPFVDWALNEAGRTRGPLDRAFHLAVNPIPPNSNEIALAEKVWDELGVTAKSGSTIACYTGTFSHRLDVMTVAKGVKALPTSYQERLKLVLCGRGETESELRALAEGSKSIVVPGWRNVPEIHVLLRRSSLGVLPYPSADDFLLSFPNKLGEYLSAGLPVLTGLGGLTHKLLEERGIGLRYTEGDISSVTASFQKIVDMGPDLDTFKPRALATYRELFNGREIYPAFCRHIEGLASRSS